MLYKVVNILISLGGDRARTLLCSHTHNVEIYILMFMKTIWHVISKKKKIFLIKLRIASQLMPILSVHYDPTLP